VSLQPGQKLLHYDVVEKIGEGGMGEVYRATDTKLGREVAIKTLPQALSGDAERLARFQREAQVLASLNHPNIAAIYGLEQVDQTHFLVLELIEGPDLSERLKQGPLAVEQVLDIGRQIAEGLEVAHEQGVVHRDLKPANVKLTPDGKVKVLDFGLAKALEAGPDGGSDPSLSPTITSAATQAGVIMGTAAYMSPEQARGSTVDKRADIWSFGCVLLELLTGRNPFVADTISDTLASVLRSDPDWKELPKDSPALRRLVKRCLDKDPMKRLRDIGEARIAIETILAGDDESVPEATTAPASSRKSLVITAIAILLTAAITLLVVRALSPEPPPEQTRRFRAIHGTFLDGNDAPPRLSPDGRKIVFSRDDSLWVQHLDQLEPQKLRGTVGAVKPAWSPDSESIAFSAREDLKVVPASGGEVTTVAVGIRDVSTVGGISWGPDGNIAFTSGNGGLAMVPARGGDPKVVLQPDDDQEDDFHELEFLPDGNMLFVIHRAAVGPDTLAVLDQGSSRYLFSLDSGRLANPVYSPTGHILYRRSQAKSGLWAVPFSLDSLETTGEPFLITPDAHYPSVADDGTLLYVRGDADPLRQLVWVDRDGVIDEQPLGQPLQGIAAPSLSPDGTRVAVMGREGETGNIWIYDIERKTRSRLTFGSNADWDPTWTPDGKDVVFWNGDTQAISKKSADGGGEIERIVKVDLRDSGIPTISSDGKWMVFWMLPTGRGGLGDIFYMDLESGNDPLPIILTEFDEFYAGISPDGTLVAYDSDESGGKEVYLTRFPSGDGRWQVSVDGGSHPVWSPAGDELFYTAGTRVHTVQVDTRDGVRLSSPETLFDLEGTGISTSDPRRYDVSNDGRRFVMVQDVRDKTVPPAVVLNYNWIEPFRDE